VIGSTTQSKLGNALKYRRKIDAEVGPVRRVLLAATIEYWGQVELEQIIRKRRKDQLQCPPLPFVGILQDVQCLILRQWTKFGLYGDRRPQNWMAKYYTSRRSSHQTEPVNDWGWMHGLLAKDDDVVNIICQSHNHCI